MLQRDYSKAHTLVSLDNKNVAQTNCDAALNICSCAQNNNLSQKKKNEIFWVDREHKQKQKVIIAGNGRCQL